MRAILFVAGLWLAVVASNSWAACDDLLREKLTRAKLDPDQMKIVCGDDGGHAALATQQPSPVSAQVAVVPVPVVSNKQEDAKKDKNGTGQHAMLESHFPTSLGMTKDNDDVWFLDANISLRYPLMYEGFANRGCNPLHALPYFSFTGRFAQYIGTRDSSPVVMKAFNPEVFTRFYLSPKASDGNTEGGSLSDICKKGEEEDLAYHNERMRGWQDEPNTNTEKKKELGEKLGVKAYLSYVDVLYGHLSNGQGISDSTTLTTFASTLGNKTAAQNPEFAKDYISRGWDYVGIAWTKMYDKGDSLYLRINKYVGGLLQQQIEEIPWESPSSKISRLQQVNGMKARYATSNREKSDFNFVAALDTGTQSPFKYNTVRMEVIRRCDFLDVPTKFWIQQGYNSDLAQYYKSVRSFGFTLQFTTFDGR